MTQCIDQSTWIVSGEDKDDQTIIIKMSSYLTIGSLHIFTTAKLTPPYNTSNHAVTNCFELLFHSLILKLYFLK